MLSTAFGLSFAAFALLPTASARPDVLSVPDLRASADPEVIEAGRYLGTAVAQCALCHVTAPADGSEATQLDGPLSGGFTWQVPGFVTMIAANISPDPDVGIGAWSDADVARAVRYATGPDGKLLPLMYFHVGPMSDEDLEAILSWLRSTEPDATPQEADQLKLLGRLFLGAVQPTEREAPPYAPAGELSVERGRYLALGPANCGMCHSPMKGLKQVEPAMSGGTRAEVDLHDPDMEWLAPNLTPDPETGHLQSWSEDDFVARFRAGSADPNPLMPWNAYRHLTESDLRSLYRYLQSLPPTRHATGPGYRERGWKAPRE